MLSKFQRCQVKKQGKVAKGFPTFTNEASRLQIILTNRARISVSERWVFYAVPTARVIFMAKTSLNIFNGLELTQHGLNNNKKKNK